MSCCGTKKCLHWVGCNIEKEFSGFACDLLGDAESLCRSCEKHLKEAMKDPVFVAMIELPVYDAAVGNE